MLGTERNGQRRSAQRSSMRSSATRSTSKHVFPFFLSYLLVLPPLLSLLFSFFLLCALDNDDQHLAGAVQHQYAHNTFLSPFLYILLTFLTLSCTYCTTTTPIPRQRRHFLNSGLNTQRDSDVYKQPPHVSRTALDYHSVFLFSFPLLCAFSSSQHSRCGQRLSSSSPSQSLSTPTPFIPLIIE